MIALFASAYLALAAGPATAPRSAPIATTSPTRVRPGDAFLVRVQGLPLDSKLKATVAGRALTFFPLPQGLTAVAALPVETPAGRLPITVTWPSATPEGGQGSLSLAIEVTAPKFSRRSFSVQPRYVKEPTPELAQRMASDREAFAQAFGLSGPIPFFVERFDWPRAARVTAHFGEERTLNGVKPSQHYGVDLAGKVGDLVAAANDGKVVLIRDCWLSGQTVVIWHGAEIFTTYFHLSRILVHPGDRVARGQPIGQVGQTGRASGPHLHWGVRVGDLYVDPESVLRLNF